jgi:glutaminase
MKNIRKDEFLKKYRRIVEIMKVFVQNSAIKVLMYFWDAEYRCFTFENVKMCPPLKEYGLLTEFPKNLYKLYFHQKRNKVLIDLAELIQVPDLHEIMKNV